MDTASHREGPRMGTIDTDDQNSPAVAMVATLLDAYTQAVTACTTLAAVLVIADVKGDDLALVVSNEERDKITEGEALILKTLAMARLRIFGPGSVYIGYDDGQ